MLQGPYKDLLWKEGIKEKTELLQTAEVGVQRGFRKHSHVTLPQKGAQESEEEVRGRVCVAEASPNGPLKASSCYPTIQTRKRRLCEVTSFGSGHTKYRKWKQK